MSHSFKIILLCSIFFFAENDGTPAKYYNTFVQRVKHPIHIQNIGITNKGFPFPFGYHSRLHGRNVICKTKGKQGCFPYPMPLVHAPIVAPVVAHPFMPHYYADHVANCHDESHEHNPAFSQYLNKFAKKPRKSKLHKDRYESHHPGSHKSSSGSNSEHHKKPLDTSGVSSEYSDNSHEHANVQGFATEHHGIPKQGNKAHQKDSKENLDNALKNPIIKEIIEQNPELLDILHETLNNNKADKGHESGMHEYSDVSSMGKDSKGFKGGSQSLSGSQDYGMGSGSVESEHDKLLKELINNQGSNSASETFASEENKKTKVKDSSQFPEHFGEQEYFISGNGNSGTPVQPLKQGLRQVTPKPVPVESSSSSKNTGEFYEVLKPEGDLVHPSSESTETMGDMSMSTSRPYVLNGKVVTLTPSEVKNLQQNGITEHELKLIPMGDDSLVREILKQYKNKHETKAPTSSENFSISSTSPDNSNQSPEGDKKFWESSPITTPKNPTHFNSISMSGNSNPKLENFKHGKNQFGTIEETNEYLTSSEEKPKSDSSKANSPMSYEYEGSKSSKYAPSHPQPSAHQVLTSNKCPRFDTLYKHFLQGLDKFLEKLQECPCTREAFGELFKNIHGYC